MKELLNPWSVLFGLETKWCEVAILEDTEVLLFFSLCLSLRHRTSQDFYMKMHIGLAQPIILKKE